MSASFVLKVRIEKEFYFPMEMCSDQAVRIFEHLYTLVGAHICISEGLILLLIMEGNA